MKLVDAIAADLKKSVSIDQILQATSVRNFMEMLE
jgi:hypothetical protein